MPVHAKTSATECPPATRLPSPRSQGSYNARIHGNGGQAPGVLHHDIIRGIGRRKIFLNYLFKKPSKDSS